MGSDELGDSLRQLFQQLVAEGTLTIEQLETEGTRIAADVTEKSAIAIIRDLKGRMPSGLREARREKRDFEKRNLQRWRKAFNLIETLYHVAFEIGSKFNDEERPKIIAEQDYRGEALIHIHARSLLVTNECICLMKSGYPDGALARWRTLHELNVVAALLSDNSTEVALRYLVSFDLRALEAGKQMKKYAARSGMEPPTDAEIEALRVRCEAHLKRWPSMAQSGDYGWASDVVNSKRPSLLDLEEAVGLDHWRPRFKWSSQHNHGGHRPVGSLLAVTEAREPIFITGPSNSGMVDPLHMTAISLANMTTALLTSREPHFTRTIVANVLLKLSNEIAEAALAVEHVKPS
ncbi:hypothetical protein AOQ73_36360 [Bradyrhizobium pachyrhizi]|uniref:DUF5677 domain-containing protein n=1 Tax=Bradyrhizobium pachyrhizi TaxID=280333 RepID=UPI000712F705|nr:DUF5677 domain-containing protein [Bradyrhizobium pachyrhizi]KRP85955.1 hypothetical protein AOQ73_36360 [Bradyrhizobium pachyrhizi]